VTLIPWQSLGLRVVASPRALGVGLLVGAAFGVYMAASDIWLYSSILPPGISGPLPAQLAYFATFSALDEIEWRLIAMSLLVWLLAIFAGRPRAWCYWAALAIVAVVVFPCAHIAYFAALPRVPLTVVRELTLHGSAGMLWGWLYWKRGLLASMAGHIGAHLTLQPLLGLL
jgi:hypothetical protein